MMPPAAWFDLVGRVDQAAAVASCILTALPDRPDSQADINRAYNLAAAVIDLLMLAERDVVELERQLKAV